MGGVVSLYPQGVERLRALYYIEKNAVELILWYG